MFEELTDLHSSVTNAAGSRESHTSTAADDEDDGELYSKQHVLTSTNYSWTARSGMKVIVDSELKQGKIIPSPSMYSRKPYIVDERDSHVVSAFESDGTADFYKSFFKCRVNPEKSRSNSEDLLLKDDDNAVVHSPAPTSHTSGATDCSAQTEKRLASDSGLSHFPVCTCAYIKSEACEHSSDGYGVSLTNSKKDCNTFVLTESVANTESTVKVKEADGNTEVLEEGPVRDLHALEAKLQSSRKRR